MKLYIEDINIPSLEDEDYRYLEMRSEGRRYYNIYRGIKNNKGVWAAVEVDGKTMKEIGEPFEITYDQGRGLEPIDPDNNRLQKMVGKALGLRRESIVESPVATVYTGVNTYIIPDVPEEYADEIISFATRTNDVENCEWTPVSDDLGQIEITTDPFIFKMLLLWAYRKGFTETDKRISTIMHDNNIFESKRTKRIMRSLKEQDVEIEVKNKGILEVPEGKNVDDLPVSHFEKLVKKNGLSKITKALNNLQVWNKNDDKKLSKWAGDMIDKLTKKYGKNESAKYRRRSMKESSMYDYYDTPDNAFDMHNDMPTEEDEWWASIPSELRAVVHEMEETGWEGVGFTTTGVDYCISKEDKNRPELSYEMCVSIYDRDNSVSLSKYVDIFDWDKEKYVSRIQNTSGVREFRTKEDVRRFAKWFNSLGNMG